MKSETDLQLLARQWGATAVPFGPISAQAWLDTPAGRKASDHLNQTAALRSVAALERSQRRGQKRPGRPLDALAGSAACSIRCA